MNFFRQKTIMDEDKKKSTLRMIPYGTYVMTAKDRDGNVGAGTVNWVTQTSFDPPLVAIGVKRDTGLYATVKAAGKFTLNLLGKGQQSIAFGFFKPLEVNGNVINGEPVSDGANGAPLLDSAPAAIECKVVDVVELGDHHIVVGEVTEVHQAQPPEGRADEAILEMKELGDNVFYGG